MIWTAPVLLSVTAMLALGIAIERESGTSGRYVAASSPHRAQMIEIERNLEAGEITETERDGAVLGVRRRLFTSADEREAKLRKGTNATLRVALAGVPAIALALYLRAEVDRGDISAAAAAGNAALTANFDSTLAAATTEALSERVGADALQRTLPGLRRLRRMLGGDRWS